MQYLLCLLWPTVRNSNPTDVDLRTDYEIEDVKRGTVYGVTTWLHLHEQTLVVLEFVSLLWRFSDCSI